MMQLFSERKYASEIMPGLKYLKGLLQSKRFYDSIN